MKKLKLEKKARYSKLALAALLLFVAFVAADLIIISVREYFLPTEAPPKKNQQFISQKFTDRSQYSIITQRNLFSSLGKIPDPLVSSQQTEIKEDVPVLSALPLVLIGTLVHTNPAKSVAAIEIKSKSISASFMAGAEIENLARIEKIERGIVYFRNLNNGALEYIEMSQGNTKVTFDNKPTVGAVPVNKEIEKIGDNTFRIKRSDLNKYLSDMSSVLMQARAIPNKDLITGEINGFRLVDYQPGSIFEQLGIPKGAIIKSANGEEINSIQSAMAMFNQFKSGADRINLGLDINGAAQTFNYEISK